MAEAAMRVTLFNDVLVQLDETLPENEARFSAVDVLGREIPLGVIHFTREDLQMLGMKTPVAKLLRIDGVPVIPSKVRKTNTCAACGDRITVDTLAYRSATNVKRNLRWCLPCGGKLGEPT